MIGSDRDGRRRSAVEGGPEGGLEAVPEVRRAPALPGARAAEDSGELRIGRVRLRAEDSGPESRAR